MHRCAEPHLRACAEAVRAQRLTRSDLPWTPLRGTRRFRPRPRLPLRFRAAAPAGALPHGSPPGPKTGAPPDEKKNQPAHRQCACEEQHMLQTSRK